MGGSFVTAFTSGQIAADPHLGVYTVFGADDHQFTRRSQSGNVSATRRCDASACHWATHLGSSRLDRLHPEHLDETEDNCGLQG